MEMRPQYVSSSVMNKHMKGRVGEDIAADYLKKRGFKIIEKNFRCKIGEIDIIAKKGGNIHFIEVKYRENPVYGSPFESITLHKARQIVKVAKYFIAKYKRNVPCHFSVIGITGGSDVTIEFLQDAFGEV